MSDINEKIADIILNNHFILLVLERFGIKLGIKEKTIREICAEHGINVNVFSAICNLHIEPEKTIDLQLQIADIKVIVSYLENSHKYYKSEVLPKLTEQIHSIIKNDSAPPFILIERFFEEYKHEVMKHLEYEETKVYPYAIQLISGNGKKTNYKISKYKNHHDDIETKLLDLKHLLIKHIPVKNDQILRRDLLLELFRFEKDLRIHTIIEENILAPAIEKIENNSK